MDDETRGKVREAVREKVARVPVIGIDRAPITVPSMAGVMDAIVAGVEAALDSHEEREPKPAPDSGVEVELPWRSTADGGSDYVSPNPVKIVIDSVRLILGAEYDESTRDACYRVKTERDEARAEVERIRKDMQALWHQIRDGDQLVTRLRSELRQARKLAPETVRLLRRAKRWEVAVLDNVQFQELCIAVSSWQKVGCPDLPQGGDDDR